MTTSWSRKETTITITTATRPSPHDPLCSRNEPISEIPTIIGIKHNMAINQNIATNLLLRTMNPLTDNE